MKKGSADLFPPAAYHTPLGEIPAEGAWNALARRVYEQTFRTDFAAPGFALISFTVSVDSVTLRRCLVRLKESLADLFARQTGRALVYRSLARFDQQVTTKFHLDGGPAESFLLLGYEPSEVESQVNLADYTRASWELGIDPARFLADLNPMFADGEKLLLSYLTRLAFDYRSANVLVINNSSLPYEESSRNLLGVMHQAAIPRPDPGKRRVINSSMLFAATSPEDEEVSRERQAEFIVTERISGRDDY